MPRDTERNALVVAGFLTAAGKLISPTVMVEDAITALEKLPVGAGQTITLNDATAAIKEGV